MSEGHEEGGKKHEVGSRRDFDQLDFERAIDYLAFVKFLDKPGVSVHAKQFL